MNLFPLHCRGPALAGSRGYPRDERRQQEKTHETSLDGAKSAREGEREKEREKERVSERVTRLGVQQSLAMLYFLL